MGDGKVMGGDGRDKSERGVNGGVGTGGDVKEMWFCWVSNPRP